MASAHVFLLNLAMIFSVAAVVTVLFHRLKLPVVLGYLLAGMLVGPNVPHYDLLPIANHEVVESLAELGLILLMFAIGLEFELRKLVSVAPTGGLIALGEVSFVAWLGFQAASLMGWTTTESLFVGAMVAISSTSIIAMSFEEKGIAGRWRDVVFSILVVEDVAAILLLVALGLYVGGSAVEPAGLGLELLRLVVSLGALLGVGLLIIPRFFRYVVATARGEMLVVSSVGLGFAIALLTQHMGYSVALGAFLGGTMVAESGHGHKVFEAIQPVRDVFAALFFVAVGMLIDPALLLPNAGAILLLVAVVMVGKFLGVGIGSFLLGNGIRTAVQAGMSMTQIGEFSFVIATLGISAGVIREELYPVAVAVSVVTTFTTPLAIGAADPLARWLDHKLPHRLQTWSSLYTAWIEQLRSPSSRPSSVRRNLLLALVGDVLAFGALGAAFGMFGENAVEAMTHAGMGPFVATIVLEVVFVLLCAPLGLGIVRLSGSLADDLLAPVAEKLAGNTPGLLMALSAGVRVAITLLAGLVALALVMPWRPAWPLVLAFLALEAFLVVLLWRSAATMEGEITPGAALIARAILQGTSSGGVKGPENHHKPPNGQVTLQPGSHAIGRSLVELDVRARTGASIVSIERPGHPAAPPNGREPLEEGSTLTVVGPDAAVLAAEALLLRGAAPGDVAAK